MGGTEASFTAKFGDPTSQMTLNGAPALMYDTGNSNVGQLGIVLIPNTHVVFGLVVTSPTGQVWDAPTAVTICSNYLPNDTKLNKPQLIKKKSSAEAYQSGYSAELAHTLNPGLFLAVNGKNLVKPGTLSVIFDYAARTGNTVNICLIQLGEQPS